MKLGILNIILALFILISCSTEKHLYDDNLRNNILSYYFNSKEISKQQEYTISSNFKKYINSNKMILYKGLNKKFIEINFISINVSETTTHLIVLTENQKKFIEINKNYEFVINEIKKLDENYLIKNYNGILSEIQKVDLSNRTLKSKNILLPYGNK